MTSEVEMTGFGIAKGPKITIDHIEGSIIKEVYDVVEGTNVTICILTIKNGFNVVAYSACVSDENFNEDIGRTIARKKAIDKCWPLFGFYLASILTDFTMDS